LTTALQEGLSTLACAKAPLKFHHAPFDPKSMPFMHEYDSMELTGSAS
jgi:hypothetical protein